METRPIAFLSDFGLQDPSVGICLGVMLSIDPRLTVIDVTHEIVRQDVASGALALAEAAPYMPDRFVGLAIVDPGVGSERRAIAVETADDSTLVGPDNGLLVEAADLRGGVRAAVELSNSPWRLMPVSPTFHGRDIFAPVAAHLAGGAELTTAGAQIDPSSLRRLERPANEAFDRGVSTTVASIDRYGNLRLAATLNDLPEAGIGAPLSIAVGDVDRPAALAHTYEDSMPGEVVVLVDSTGSLSVAIGGGDAAELLGVAHGDRITLRVEA